MSDSESDLNEYSDSDVENEELQDEDPEQLVTEYSIKSTDDDIQSIKESSRLSKKDIKDNKFYKIIYENTKYPTRYLAHTICQNRLNQFGKGAEPLVEDSKADEFLNSSKDCIEINEHLFQLVLDEIEQEMSPILIFDPFFNEFRHISFYNKSQLLDILTTDFQLSKE